MPAPQPAAPTPAPADPPAPPAPAAPPAEPPDTGVKTQAELQAEVDKWKAMSRKHEGDAKANFDAAKRLKDIEDADKTEVQKATEAAAAATKRADEAEARALRAEVAAAKGLPPTLVKRLSGTTREELEADADELLADFGKKDPPKPAAPKGGKPIEKLRPGAVPDAEDEPPNYSEIAARIAKAPAYGRR